MHLIQGPFRASILFCLISAALLILAVLPASFDSAAFGLIPYGVGSLLLAVGLARGWRWFGYLAFFATFIGGIAAMSGIWANNPVPGWWFLAILAANWLAAAALFVALWRPRPEIPAN